MIRRLPAGQGIDAALAAERLGVPAVLFFVMSAAAPLTVVAGTLSTAVAVTGSLGLPAAFVAVGLLLGVFSVGYVAMSRHLPHAGAFYAYVAHGLGRTLGVSAAWISLLAYDLIQVSLYGAIGAAASPLVHTWWGLDLSWWVFALAAWALVALLGLLRVDVNGSVLAALLVCEVVLIVGYDISYVSHPAQGLAWSSWSPTELTGPGVGAILAIAVLGFVGFESAVVFAEESRHSRRTIPVSTCLSVALIAGLYGVSAWAMTVAAGPAQLADAARAQGPELVFSLAGAHLGTAMVTAGHALFATSITGAMISFHATAARYVFALGREGVLPAVFGRTSTSGSPRAGSIAQSIVGLVVIVGFVAGGADPVVSLFYTASTSGALGVLILLVLAGLAVLRYFAVDPRGEGVWRTAVSPALAVLGLSLVLTLVLANFAALLGVPEDSPLRWGIPATFAAVAAAGAGYGHLLKSWRPQVYAVIGTGAKAVLLAPAAGGYAALRPNAPIIADTVVDAGADGGRS